MKAKNFDKGSGIYIVFPNLLTLPHRLYKGARINLLLRKLTMGDKTGNSERFFCANFIFLFSLSFIKH